jgi:hypothetical protein|tara:strand:- start:152 stop:439 length:288 start_codon:yes stop_codon:yes gene_type:complete
MNQIKWTNGIKPTKSNKSDKQLYIPDNDQEINQEIRQEINQEINNFSSNKREFVNDKINQRELIQNTCKNPFFESQDYMQHLSNQEQFLRPQKTN